MAQLVKNPSAMQETWVQSLSWEDPLEEGKTKKGDAELGLQHLNLRGDIIQSITGSKNPPGIN